MSKNTCNLCLTCFSNLFHVQLGNLMDISKDMLPLLLSEVKFHNSSFPTDRVYHQLSLRKNRDSKTKQNGEDHSYFVVSIIRNSYFISVVSSMYFL